MKYESIIKQALTSLAILAIASGCVSQPLLSKPLAVQPTSETSQSAAKSPPNSIAGILKPDGTIDSTLATNANFDAKGYRMEYTSSGAPRFVPEFAPDDYWSGVFGQNGVDGEVTAIVTYGANIYVAQSYGGPSIVSKWNGFAWVYFPPTFTDGKIRALSVDEPNIYIGGDFTRVGNVTAHYLAKWNGSSWSEIGGGTSGPVNTLVGLGPALYVGGSFDSAGGLPGTARIAFWAATHWETLGNGLPNTIVYCTDFLFGPPVTALYVGGFDTVQNRGILWKWTGTWTQVPGNFDIAVRAVAAFDSSQNSPDIYAGGFNNVNGIVGTKGIAHFTGTWSSVGGGLDSPDVRTIEVGLTGLCVGGNFSMAGTRLVNNVAVWNDITWSEFQAGTNGPVNALQYDSTRSQLDVGGNFTAATGTPTNHIAAYDGTSWSALRDSLNGGVYAVALVGDDVYVGGIFSSAQGVAGTRGIAKWNGATYSWSSVGGGLNGNVYAMTVRGNSLFVGGTFTSVSGSPGLAKWDGTDWTGVCSGVSGGQVSAIGVDVTGRVYAGGEFTSAGGVPNTGFLARCDANQWQALATGVNQPVNALVVTDNEVYVGGAFTTAGGIPNVNRIARWDGDAWSKLANGANNQVLALARDVAGNLYAGGLFVSMDGVPNTVHIAKWNGSSWSALGTGINGTVWSLTVGRGIVYAGGQFSNAGGHAANDIAAWVGGNWAALGSGTNAVVRAITQRAKSLWVGGGFSLAGNKPSYFFGQYFFAASTPFDFDGDNKSDVSIFRPNAGEWWLLRSGDGGNNAFVFGAANDKLAPADFTGDGKTDIAVWRPSTGQWFIIRSENNTFYGFPFGANGDIPVPADYDADLFADPAIYRPSTSTFYLPISSNSGAVQTIQFGIAGDKPVVADYDADGKADVAIYRPTGGSGSGEWWILRSTGGAYATVFGNSSDRAVPGDYTGDGKTDIAIWRPSTGQWFIVRSEDNSFYGFPFGANGDVPVPGDYDGDGRNDAAVFRQPGATWYITKSSGGTTIQGFGITGDVPVESAFVR
jgi:hypothetical protein